MKRVLKIAAICFTVFALLVFLNNTSLLAPEPEGGPLLLAHRGVHQTFTDVGLTNQSCTATMIYPPEHEFLENTLPSIAEAFRLGAQIVEIDIYYTTDGAFAIFHDWNLDCRTEGTGAIYERPMSYLKTLDIGYGYTADGGKTFPFRGKFTGAMPTLDEVLAEFPHQRFLLNFKSDSVELGELLGERLSRLSPEERARLMVYGGRGDPTGSIRRRFPEVRAMDSQQLMRCAVRYMALGWSGYMPALCRNTIVFVPQNYAWVVWGWPNRFLARMKAANSEAFVISAVTAGDLGTRGIDSVEEFRALPARYGGGIWTNRIERIGPLAKRTN